MTTTGPTFRRQRAQSVERAVDVTWFEKTATCRGEDEAGVAPLGASGEALFKLSSAVPAQNAHQRGRDDMQAQVPPVRATKA
jgi:hypothetical protein